MLAALAFVPEPAAVNTFEVVSEDFPLDAQRRRYLDSNQRIKNIAQDYHNREIMQYLRGLAHNIISM